MTHENLKGRVAVVTGGGGVICGAFAKTLAKQGCRVAILDLNEEAAQKLLQMAARQLLLAAMCLILNLCRRQEMLLLKSSAPVIFF